MEETQVTWWGLWRFRVNYWLGQRLEGLEMAVAYRLPRRIVYWCVVRAWNNATMGKWSHVEVPAVTVREILERLQENSK